MRILFVWLILSVTALAGQCAAAIGSSTEIGSWGIVLEVPAVCVSTICGHSVSIGAFSPRLIQSLSLHSGGFAGRIGVCAREYARLMMESFIINFCNIPITISVFKRSVHEASIYENAHIVKGDC